MYSISVHKGSIFNILVIRQFHIALIMWCLALFMIFVYLFINSWKLYNKVTSNTGIVTTPQKIQLWWMTYALKTWFKVVILYSFLTCPLNLDLFECRETIISIHNNRNHFIKEQFVHKGYHSNGMHNWKDLLYCKTIFNVRTCIEIYTYRNLINNRFSSLLPWWCFS